MNCVQSTIAIGKTEIPYYSWPVDSPRALLVFVHGLKSHAGWFLDAGEALARKGVKTYAFDRRGSGLSREPRGDIPNYKVWLEDIDAVVKEAQNHHPNVPIHILGHCFGAKLALGYATIYPGRVRSLCLIAPPQQSLKIDIKPLEKIKVGLALITGQTFQVTVPIEDEMFTDDPGYYQFIKKDPLKLAHMTTRLCFEILKMDLWLKRHLKSLQLPILCLLAEHDDVVDTQLAQIRFFNRLSVDKKQLEVYNCRHHLLYEPHRHDVLERIGHWICVEN